MHAVGIAICFALTCVDEFVARVAADVPVKRVVRGLLGRPALLYIHLPPPARLSSGNVRKIRPTYGIYVLFTYGRDCGARLTKSYAVKLSVCVFNWKKLSELRKLTFLVVFA